MFDSVVRIFILILNYLRAMMIQMTRPKRAIPSIRAAVKITEPRISLLA